MMNAKPSTLLVCRLHQGCQTKQKSANWIIFGSRWRLNEENWSMDFSFSTYLSLWTRLKVYPR